MTNPTTAVRAANLAAQASLVLATQHPELAKRDRNGNCELAEAIATALHGSRFPAMPNYPITTDDLVAAAGVVIASWR